MICVKPIEQLNRAYKMPSKKHFSNYPAIKEKDLNAEILLEKIDLILNEAE